MPKRLAVLSTTAVILAGAVLPLEGATVRHRIRHLRPHVFGFRHRFPVPHPPVLEFPRPDEIPPPELEEPPLTSSPSFEPEALPHGFALTVPIDSGSKPARPASLRRYVEVGQALGACWHPPAGWAWSSVTLRVSFKRDGTVYGMPRIPFIDARSADDKSQIAHSLMAALEQCTPLPFSASLGSAIAGEIFAIRFVNQDAK